jgi:hypothetical protein
MFWSIKHRFAGHINEKQANNKQNGPSHGSRRWNRALSAMGLGRNWGWPQWSGPFSLGARRTSLRCHLQLHLALAVEVIQDPFLTLSGPGELSPLGYFIDAGDLFLQAWMTLHGGGELLDPVPPYDFGLQREPLQGRHHMVQAGFGRFIGI